MKKKTKVRNRKLSYTYIVLFKFADLTLGIASLAIRIPGLVQCNNKYQNQLELIIQISKSQTQELFLYLNRENRRIPKALKDKIVSIFQTLQNTFKRLLTISKTVKISASIKTKAKTKTLIFTLFGEQSTPAIPPTPLTPLTPPATNSVSKYRALASKKVKRLQDSIDKSLNQAKHKSQVLLNPPDKPDNYYLLPNSSLKLRTLKAKEGKLFIIKYRTYSSDALDREIKNHRQIVRKVARIIRQADPKFIGLLYYNGSLWDSIKYQFELYFPIPSGLQDPRTLLKLLCNTTNGKPIVKHPLNQHISLAKRIVTAVFVLHAANFIYKQIRPDNILVFKYNLPIPLSNTNSTRNNPPNKQGYPYILGNPFLVEFNNIHKRKSIYLSPEQHQLQQDNNFRIEHDIYSLKLKKTYISLAKGAVPRVIGQKYADIVIAYLISLDLEEGHIKSLEDKNGIIIGTSILKPLEQVI
ncbi:hypothetical protein BGZ61DRAFT_501377 [Ilyonectria robusta]|uniref:uncharacterized protein n=1 Tax=Ilyonectria robusta TaxID=1079257 RepID=UPI001E8DA93E|nr:uncharacterized protein BGZ61DRAFT_501377 [Ilyonectria robusta]KAH8645574.1 hypothetical protein BGZ61DRAFT_501377 [Ilyonectria robusta]